MERNLEIINELLPILTSGNTGVWVYDSLTDKLNFKNDFFEILGFIRWGVSFSSLEELRTLVHADDLPAFEQAFAAALAGKKTTIVCRCCGSNYRQVQVESTFLPCNNGVIALIVNKDMTSKLLRFEKQYKTVINALFPNFIFVFNDNFHFVDIITPDGVNLFHSNEELIGSDARNLYSPEVSNLFISNIRESIEKNQWKEIEYHLDLKGIRYYYQARIVPVDGDKTLCLIQDIGDRVRRMEELLTQRQRAEESDRMKSVFVANTSHEINSPLNAIIGFSEYLMKEEASEKRQKYMDVVRNSSALLLQIVNDILDLSSLEAGMGVFNFVETDVAALLIEVAEMYMPDMKPEVRLLIDAPDGDIRATTDANRIKQVLINLINNAVKNTDKGSITLKVDKKSEYLMISVIDTGRGIPEEKLEVIFGRFEKLDHFVHGTGLGLAICKTIADRLGGYITVSSKENKGSVFSFVVPYEYAMPKKDNIGSMRELVSNRRKKVLLADSSKTDIQFVSKALKKKYDIVEVIDNEKIINTYILDPPNLVLLSMEMIGKTDVIKKIRAISNTIPIILMTTNDFYHDQRWAIENGCTNVISKPFSPSNIEELVTTFIV